MTSATPSPAAPFDLNEETVELLLARLPLMSDSDKTDLLLELEQLEHKRRLEGARKDFLVFCHTVYANKFKEGPHHRHMRPLLHDVLAGTQLRLTVSMPPRFGKSETIAYLFVAWYFGHNPGHQVMMVTHTAGLSTDFGRKVRNLIDSPVYRDIFPDTVVSRDKSAADDWSTTKGGKYLAVGIGGSVAGRGADLLIGDDLVSEQAVLNGNPDTAFTTAWEYMQVGPLQRLMPGGRIIMIGTRWGKKDPIGRALEWARANPGSLPWHEIKFPAVMKVVREGEEKELSLWPEQWPVEQLLAKKAGMFPQFWAAQYMQEPTSEEAALIKREWWRAWEAEKPPECEIILHSWDTAHETKTSNDPSAVMCWGVFFNEKENQTQLILLDAWTGRKEFPDLKKFALQYYQDWEPDLVLIEKKAAGAPLIQELRAIGVPVQEFNPSRGSRAVSNDKRARLNSITDIFASKMVWAPDKRWAREVIEQIAGFPNEEHDEFVDCTSQAMLRFRQGGLIRLQSDDADDGPVRRARHKAYY